MTFSSNVMKWGNATLNHKEANLEGSLYFVKYLMECGKTDKETIEEVVNEARLLFLNQYVQTSQFVNFVNTNRMAHDQKRDFFKYLLVYIKQFHPENEFLEKVKDEHDLMEFFSKCYRTMNSLLYQFLDTNNLETVKNNMPLINRITKFYEIIEDYMIRFYGYSVIGVSGQNHIVTAANNCDKKFMDQLMQGYSLWRYQQVHLLDEQTYGFLPVLPTRDVGFPIEEYIEVSGKDDKLEHKKFVKVLK